MTRLPALILTFFILLLSFSCVEQNKHVDYSEKLEVARRLLDSLPDSTLSILRTIDFDSIDDQSQLLTAHYAKGVAKRLLLDYPNAIRELLTAEKIAEDSHDYRMLASVRRQIMILHDSIGNELSYTRYAILSADAYEACMDSDSVFDMLTIATDHLVRLHKKEELKEVYTRMDEIFHDTEDYYKSLILFHIKCDVYDSIPRYGYLVTSRRILDSINNGGDWEDPIKCDTVILMPEHIRDIAYELFSQDRDTIAYRLLETFCKYYTCTQLGNDRERGILNISKPTDPFPFNGILLTRKQFFGNYIVDVERIAGDFYYEEKIQKERTIRHQREIMIAIVLGGLLLASIIVMIFRTMHLRQRRREEELVHSASELKSHISNAKEKWISSLSKLCDTYYDAYAKESSRSRIARAAFDEIQKNISSPEFFPDLESRLDRDHPGLMTRFRAEMPDLRPDEYRLFLLNAIGFSIPTISLLMNEKRELIYTRRVRLRSKIQESDIPGRDLFLDYLE